MLIGLTGYKGSGKSTVANILKEYNFVEESFAAPLKKIAIELGFSYSEIYGSQKEKETISSTMGISGREFMQVFGTDIMRVLLPTKLPNLKLGESGSIWISTAEKKIMHLQKTNPNIGIVISDVRFLNEAESIRRLGGIIIHIDRLDNEFSNNQYSLHSSENSMVEIKSDFTIDNSKDYQHLRSQINNILKK